MRVLLADKLSAEVIDALENAGCAVTSDPGLKDDSLTEALRRLDPDVLVVRSTKVKAEHVQAARSLALIIRAGAGVNTIALDEASTRGIYVANCPGKNAAAVAELTIGHLVNLDRRIADNVADLRAGRWAKKEYSKARGLQGRTLAVLGCGNIGSEVIHRARAFGMKIRAWDKFLAPAQLEALGATPCASPLEACSGADAVTIHLALAPETRDLVGTQLLEALKPGAYVVNTSRGEVLDQAALAHAIETRGLRVGLDVYANEPGANDETFADPIARNPAVYGTHHIGASTDQASEAVGDEVVRIILSFQDTGRVPNCVNLSQASQATHLLVVRHKDEVGVLASVLDELRQDGINVQEMENIIFMGSAAACARIQLSSAPSKDALDRLDANPQIYATSLVALA